MEGRFIAYHFQPWWAPLMRPQKGKEKFVSSFQLLEDKKNLGGGDCNVPKLASANWNINFALFIFAIHD